jgi:hypothetical protein
VSVNNANLDGVHRGNTIDVYGFDPSNIIKGVSEVTMTSDILYTAQIPAFPGYVVEILEVRQKLSGTVLDPLTYTIVNNKKGWAYASGTKSNLKIQFLDQNLTGLRLEVVYLYWTQGGGIETFLTSDTYRAPGADTVTKAMPCWIVSLENLVYSAGVDALTMRQSISNYINQTVTNRLDRSDIINYMYDQGATYVNTDFIINVVKYTPEFVKEAVVVNQTISILDTDIARFYTNPTKLLDVLQQGSGALGTTNSTVAATGTDVSSGGTSY